MLLGHHYVVMPAVVGEGHHPFALVELLAADADIHLAGLHQPHYLLRTALTQLQLHQGELLAKRLHHPGQGIARLGVSGRYQQPPGIPVGEGAGQFADIVGVPQDALGDHQQLLARLRHAEQPLAVTDEEREPELLLQLADMAADPGLGGEQGVGNLGQVVVPPRRLPDNA
ncbi:hypothetical protein D3C80_1123270 [compost metagenome]